MLNDRLPQGRNPRMIAKGQADARRERHVQIVLGIGKLINPADGVTVLNGSVEQVVSSLRCKRNVLDFIGSIPIWPTKIGNSRSIRQPKSSLLVGRAPSAKYTLRIRSQCDGGHARLIHG